MKEQESRQESAVEEQTAEEERTIRSLAELTEGMADDYRGDGLPRLLAAPAAKDVRHAVLLALRQMNSRLEDVRLVLKDFCPCDDDDLPNDLSVEHDFALDTVRALEEQIEELQQGVHRWFRVIGRGPVVELDIDGVEAVRVLLATAPPWEHGQASMAVAAALEYTAKLRNRGGILAVQEQGRLEKLAREDGHPVARSDRWPWMDRDGKPLTAESSYEFAVDFELRSAAPTEEPDSAAPEAIEGSAEVLNLTLTPGEDSPILDLPLVICDQDLAGLVEELKLVAQRAAQRYVETLEPAGTR